MTYKGEPERERELKESRFMWLVGGFGLAVLILILILRPLSAAVAAMENKGVPQFQIVLILMIPIISFLIVVFRNFIGLKTFGIFTPALLSVAFLTTGLIVGLLLFGILLLVGSAVRLLFERYPLLAFPRMGAVLSIVALVVFVFMYIGSVWGVGVLIEATVFPLVILTMIIERFITVQVEESPEEALRLTFNTLIVAILVFLILEIGLLKIWLTEFPELAVIALAGNLLLGKWTGLRLTEYWRFRSERYAEL